MLRRLTALLFAAALGASTTHAAEDVTTFRLDNGMQAVVIEDHRAPVAVHMIWYRVGAADEPPGLSGIAHFLEHLMFKATDDLASGEFSSIVAANGGSDNAFTSWDYTGYFQRVAADRLSLMMEMEADRMRDLDMAPEEVLTERSVILEERAQVLEGEPGGLLNEQMRAALFQNHPYGIPIIGWRHEMEQLTRRDALDFYDRFYAPNNAILIVAGDVDPAEVRDLAEQHYGPIAPSEAIVERTRPQEPPHLAPRRLMLEDERVSNPYVSRVYLAPARAPDNQSEAAALTLLSYLLGGNRQTSVLPAMLEVEEGVSLYAGSSYNATALDDATFSLFNVPVPGVSLAEAEADLDRAIAAFLDQGVDRPSSTASRRSCWPARSTPRTTCRGWRANMASR